MKYNFNYLTLLTLNILLGRGCYEQKDKVVDQSVIDTTEEMPRKAESESEF
jgi:hypothetical protein